MTPTRAAERERTSFNLGRVGIAAGLSALAVVGTTGRSAAVRVEDMHMVRSTGWFSSPWEEESAVVAVQHVREPVPAIPLLTAPSTGEVIRAVRDRAGLTWEQISRLFGVSRRAVHLWASGGRMTAANEEALLRLAALLSSMEGAPALDVRRAVLAQLEAERTYRASTDQDISRPAATWRTESEEGAPN